MYQFVSYSIDNGHFVFALRDFSIEILMHEDQPLLLALGIEMLVKRAEEDAYYSL